MNKIMLLGFVLFLTLLSSQATIGAIDYTQVGVKNGDSFEFKLDKYTEVSGGKTTHDYNLGYDNKDYDEHYIAEGKQFSITIVDATPVIEVYDENNTYASILVEYGYNDGTSDVTFQTDESLDSNMISTRDWTGRQADMQQQIDNLDDIFGSYEGSIDLTFIDTSSEWGYKLVYDITVSDSDFLNNVTFNAAGEVRYDRKTGVLNSMDVDLTLSSNSSTNDSLSTQTKIHRLGVESDGVSLPGFELYFAAINLSLMAVVIKYRKMKN